VLGSSRRMSILIWLVSWPLGAVEVVVVSTTRSRAVKICCAVGRGGAVQDEAEKPLVLVRGGMV
jgi:hypothetical protein